MKKINIFHDQTSHYKKQMIMSVLWRQIGGEGREWKKTRWG